MFKIPHAHRNPLTQSLITIKLIFFIAVVITPIDVRAQISHDIEPDFYSSNIFREVTGHTFEGDTLGKVKVTFPGDKTGQNYYRNYNSIADLAALTKNRVAVANITRTRMYDVYEFAISIYDFDNGTWSHYLQPNLGRELYRSPTKNVQLAASGDHVFFSRGDHASNLRGIYKLNAKTGVIEASYTQFQNSTYNFSDLAIYKDELYALTGPYGWSISVYDTNSLEKKRTISLNMRAGQIVVNSDNKMFGINAYASWSHIYQFDGQGKLVSQTTVKGNNGKALTAGCDTDVLYLNSHGIYTVSGEYPGESELTIPSPSRYYSYLRYLTTRPENVCAEAANTFWTNPANQFDVDGNGRVTIMDALVAINSISLYNNRELPERNAHQTPYPDVNGDNKVTTSDALAVINELYKYY